MKAKYVYVKTGDNISLLETGALLGCNERHRVSFPDRQPIAGIDILGEAKAHGAVGVVVELDRGWISRFQAHIIYKSLKNGLVVYVYWPDEECVEAVSISKFGIMLFEFCLITLYRVLVRQITPPGTLEDPSTWQTLTAVEVAEGIRPRLEAGLQHVSPAALAQDAVKDGADCIRGVGVYLRLDYWVNILAGGGFGHTAHVAHGLARRTENLVCLMANRNNLIDEFGITQVVLDPPGLPHTESGMLLSSTFYESRVRPAIEVLKPAYIYERLVPGNTVGATVARRLNIPYIVEFNGSEASMARSFGRAWEMEEMYQLMEKTAFRQATAVVAVSAPLSRYVEDLGVPPSRILVNPNGADPEIYRPAESDEKRRIRASLGFSDSDIVLGFIGTFGGWHGIGQLADAIPRIAASVPDARFLIVGNGNLHHLVVESVRRHNLEDRVILPGLVPQQDAAIMMRACDILLSPHHSHMSDQRFFGSPTKIFEYMAFGAGIVASDLEQIGEVLKPALHPSDLSRQDLKVTDELSVLCQPGNVDEFVEAAVGLCRRRDVVASLGANARKALLENYTWDQHVARILEFVARQPSGVQTQGKTPTQADSYKQEVQQQWDNDPCGSHYVDVTKKSRLDWFKQVEAFRYETYAPWKAGTYQFARYSGKKVLEVGGGMGTDLSRFAAAGAEVTDLDLSSGHLALARENFSLRGLKGNFIQGDAEAMPFEDASFDLVYSNGVIHHTPNTQKVIDEMFRVLKPGGSVIIMVYARNSIQFWRDIFYWRGLKNGLLAKKSLGEIMSQSVEIGSSGARPLVKVYTGQEIRHMFRAFSSVTICKRQLMPHERPFLLRWVHPGILQRIMGWNLVLKAKKL